VVREGEHIPLFFGLDDLERNQGNGIGCVILTREVSKISSRVRLQSFVSRVVSGMTLMDPVSASNSVGASAKEDHLPAVDQDRQE
jgi:hypothetical protein